MDCVCGPRILYMLCDYMCSVELGDCSFQISDNIHYLLIDCGRNEECRFVCYA